ncbi:MAG: RluA family pseudouridine synthase [Parcubacteria group bacterium]|jgi:23S rRNA pseudouridine1911/1915/1917 synthase
MKTVLITDENSGNRVDKFLMEEVFFNSGETRGEIVKNIKAGNILVDDKIVKPSYVLKEGEKITVELKEKAQKLAANRKIKVEIIHQDKNMVVINKPAGLSVHPISFEEKDTLVNFLLGKFPEIENVNDGSAGSQFRPGIVHRLDRDTSGVIVVARNQKTFDALKKIFQDREVSKKYVAIVFGKLEEKSGVIEKPLARSTGYEKQVIAHKRTKTKVRPAITEYAVLGESENYSLVEVLPKTGRTHQIRIHLTSIGHPIVGDKLYTMKVNDKAKTAARQLLHAKELEFKLFRRKYAFQAEIPTDFREFADSLDLNVIKR